MPLRHAPLDAYPHKYTFSHVPLTQIDPSYNICKGKKVHIMYLLDMDPKIYHIGLYLATYRRTIIQQRNIPWTNPKSNNKPLRHILPEGYPVWKRVPTVDRVLRSCGCCKQTMLKKGGCPVIIDDYRELSNMFILGFYIKLQLYAFKVVQETLQNKLFGKIKSNKH